MPKRTRKNSNIPTKRRDENTDQMNWLREKREKNVLTTDC